MIPDCSVGKPILASYCEVETLAFRRIPRRKLLWMAGSARLENSPGRAGASLGPLHPLSCEKQRLYPRKTDSGFHPKMQVASLEWPDGLPFEGGLSWHIRRDLDVASMIRAAKFLVGTLVEVGLGLRAPSSILKLIAKRDRRAAGRTAPACGLHLEWVRYT